MFCKKYMSERFSLFKNECMIKYNKQSKLVIGEENKNYMNMKDQNHFSKIIKKIKKKQAMLNEAAMKTCQTNRKVRQTNMDTCIRQELEKWC